MSVTASAGTGRAHWCQQRGCLFLLALLHSPLRKSFGCFRPARRGNRRPCRRHRAPPPFRRQAGRQHIFSSSVFSLLRRRGPLKGHICRSCRRFAYYSTKRERRQEPICRHRPISAAACEAVLRRSASSAPFLLVRVRKEAQAVRRAPESVDSDSFRTLSPTPEGVFKSPPDVQARDRLRACADSAGAAGSGVRRNRISEICLSKRRDRGMEVFILAFYIS